MSLNDTPSGERIHIGFFGRRNAGKSSVVNAVTGQDLAVVSRVEGTTTDPVKKAMELLPLGPVVIIDTPGFDDEGALGELRVKKTRQILAQTDIAVLVIDSQRGRCACDEELVGLFKERKIPYVLAWNKSDLAGKKAGEKEKENTASAGLETCSIRVSALTGEGIYALKEKIGELYSAWKAEQGEERKLVSDLLEKGDQVILVIPIDKAAPKGRLILPQQQVIRDLLDARCTAVCIQEDNVKATLESMRKPPAMVITDSQVFARVQEDVPEEVPLTSFSILMALFVNCSEGSRPDRPSAGWRQGPHRGGMHPSPPVRRHRDGQDPPLAPHPHRKRHPDRDSFRNRIPGGPDSFCTGHSLWRLHAQRTRDAKPYRPRQGPECARD